MESSTLELLRDLSYDNAKKKGFYTDEQDDMAYIAAIHEELSEAFSAWNKLGSNNAKTWYHLNPKPDGIYFELTDAVIRVLSFCGYKGYTLDECESYWNQTLTKEDICDFICNCHVTIGQYYEISNQELIDEHAEELAHACISRIFSTFISMVESFIDDSSNGEYSLIELIDTKLKYNSQREFKHGGHEV